MVEENIMRKLDKSSIQFTGMCEVSDPYWVTSHSKRRPVPETYKFIIGSDGDENYD